MVYVDNILEQFEVWVGRAPRMPPWLRVRFVDASEVDYGQPVPRVVIGSTMTLDEFRPSLELILGEGYPWINLVALGVAGDTLVVAVERSSGFRLPGIRTPVNFSGCEARNTSRGVELVEDAEC